MPELKPAYRIAPFEVDLTPPIGHPLAYGTNLKVDSPIYLRGVVLDDGGSRAVIAVADYIFLYGGAYHQWKRLLSRATGAPPAQVLLHSVHQHDSVRAEPEASDLLEEFGFEPVLDAGYWREVTAKVETAVRGAVQPGRKGAWRVVTSLATAERRVSGLASNRRLRGADGKIWGMRFSMCTDRRMRSEPVGLIDPILRTIGFMDGRGNPIACLHFYATHPMAAYRRDMVGADVPGRALDHVHDAAGGRHVYLTGCGGDVTFGKYCTGSKEEGLAILGERLGMELEANTKALTTKSYARISVRRSRFVIPLDKRFTLVPCLKSMLVLCRRFIPSCGVALARHIPPITAVQDNLASSRISCCSLGKSGLEGCQRPIFGTRSPLSRSTHFEVF